MKTEITHQLVNAIVIQPSGRTRLQKVIKNQIFVVYNGIKQYCIGNIYHNRYDDSIIEIKKEF